jgi:hypothetical protein
LAELEKGLRTSVECDAEQEQLKAKLVKSTGNAVEVLDATYKKASSMLDAVTGVFGKHSPLAKRLRKLREQMANVAARGQRASSS